MDQGALAQFITITGVTTSDATQYLQLAEGNLEGAINLYFANEGASLEQPVQTSQAPPVCPPTTRPLDQRQRQAVIDIDSDDDIQPDPDEDELRITGSTKTEAALRTPPVAAPPPGHTIDEDEAMARRLQEELYSGGRQGPSDSRAETLDEEGYRAPLQRTTETLVGPGGFDLSDPEDMRAAVFEQMRARRQPRQHRDRPGIFNQATDSIWNEGSTNQEGHRDVLARATGGASEASAKANTLAEMYRPPFELMSRLGWDEARDQGKEGKKWIIVNIQDPSIFDCQLLNRDIWKNPSIMETVKENFIFMQYSKDDQQGNQYTQYYFQNKDLESAYPHIAIVDPRTGEQVKKWSGPPAPKAPDFLMQLHEFLDRYSLQATAKNPVAKRKPEIKQETQLDRLTEEQQMEMAMQASLAGAPAQKDDDPDDLTRNFDNITDSKAKGKETEATDMTMADPVDGSSTNGNTQPPSTSIVSTIPSTKPHTEPASTEPNTTRIQFRHPTGRVVRRFSLSDKVRRLYEWLKAAPLEGQGGKDFELVFMQKNLIDSLDESVEQAGLKNGTVMVEIIETEG